MLGPGRMDGLPALLALVAGLSGVGCGARTDLGIGVPPNAAAELPCGRASPGAGVWQISLSSDQTFTGTWAVDDAGATYFLGTSPKQYPTSYTIVALDSCGALRWQSAPLLPGFLNGASPDLVVDGDRVLFQWGTVDAFDRATGAHLWNADLDAHAGEKLAADDFAEIGPLAIAADGTAFLTMTPESSPSTQWARRRRWPRSPRHGRHQRLGEAARRPAASRDGGEPGRRFARSSFIPSARSIRREAVRPPGCLGACDS